MPDRGNEKPKAKRKSAQPSGRKEGSSTGSNREKDLQSSRNGVPHVAQ